MSKKRTDPRGGADGNIDHEVDDVRLFVIPKHVRPYDPLQLRIEMLEKARPAEKKPVEKEYVVELHAIKNHEESRKEPEKAESVFYAVPCADNDGGYEQQKGEYLYDPADDVRAGEAFLLIGDHSQILLWCGGKKRLS